MAREFFFSIFRKGHVISVMEAIGDNKNIFWERYQAVCLTVWNRMSRDQEEKEFISCSIIIKKDYNNYNTAT